MASLRGHTAAHLLVQLPLALSALSGLIQVQRAGILQHILLKSMGCAAGYVPQTVSQLVNRGTWLIQRIYSSIPEASMFFLLGNAKHCNNAYGPPAWTLLVLQLSAGNCAHANRDAGMTSKHAFGSW